MGKRKTQVEFINQSKMKHNNFYIYDKVNYIDCNTKVIIICPKHKDFLQQPRAHTQGQGCKKCQYDEKSQTQNEFIEKAKLKHNNFYLYSKVNYKGSIKKIIIICPKHGDFKQRPDLHLFENGCPKCSKGNCSKIQIEWLEIKKIIDNTPIQHFHNNIEYKVKINKKEYKVDGYSNDLNNM